MRQNIYAHTLNCATANNILIPVSECNALLDLYDSTNGSSWTSNFNRDTNINTCGSRYGVSCVNISGQLHVEELNLPSNNLVGRLPESLSGLSYLRTFNVTDNQLSGTLYDSWSSLINMEYFNIGLNQLTGSLPTSWSTWTKIKEFNANFNQLTGSLPTSWSTWTGILDFQVGFNQLSGPLPDSWSTWINIVSTYFGFNQLSGLLPDSWSERTNITQLAFNDNQLSGPLPDSWSGMINMSYFDASNNNLYGPLPDSWNTWTMVEQFIVNNNNFIGYIPSSWYGNRTNVISYLLHFENNCIYKSGYSSGMQTWLDTFTVLDPQNLCYTLNYTGNLGGVLSGNVSQTLQPNGTGTAVTATANTGYRFSGWDDGYTGTTRIDGNITGNNLFTALFVTKTYSIEYIAGTGGAISGFANQIVDYGNDGTLVTAVPSSGYSFVRWLEDGYTGATRFETNVTSGLIFTALFTGSAVVSTGSTGGTGGGGGGGGGGILVDNCPNGDFSPSYYDNTCVGSGGSGGSIGSGGGGNPGGSGSIGGTGGTFTGHNAAPIFTQDFVCKYTDGDFERYKTSFIDMGVYKDAIRIGLGYCIFHGQKKGEEFRPYAYTTYGASYKIFVRLAGLEVREPTVKLGNKRSDRYKRIGTKAGLRKGVSFPTNPDTLIDSRVFGKMLQNLFTYYGYNDLKASDFVKGRGKLTRGKMSQIVAEVLLVLERE